MLGYHFVLGVVTKWEWGKGLVTFERDSSNPFYLYTNRGVATHPPLRLFCDPEITLFEFVVNKEEQGITHKETIKYE
jgi:predicted MPP superfamily phosphohydrolase